MCLKSTAYCKNLEIGCKEINSNVRVAFKDYLRNKARTFNTLKHSLCAAYIGIGGMEIEDEPRH